MERIENKESRKKKREKDTEREKLGERCNMMIKRRVKKQDSVGEGEGGKIWENGIETCKISCMK